ncbi:MAG: hypothetical protein MJK04_15610 [Psychrosphaera sp.]|nr:hypothetical protein [Psychrosphaera sp.]
MKKLNLIKYGLLLVLLSSTNVAASEEPQMGQDSNKCPYQPLYRTVDALARKTMMTPVDDPLFMSETYCFGYFAHGREDYRLLPGYFKGETAIFLQRRYTKAYRTLQTTEQRVAFVHLFLKSLTHKVLVLPTTVRIEPKQIKVFLTMNGDEPNNTSLFHMAVTPKGHAAVHDGLIALKDGSLIAEQWLQLVELVDEVIKG